MVEWLAGNRIKGTSTERTAGTAEVPEIPAVSGGWKELDRTTLGSAGDTINVTGLDDKRYLMILGSKIPSGSSDLVYRFNSDANNNYCIRFSDNYGSDGTGTGQSRVVGDNGGSTTPSFQVGFVANKSDKEKLLINNAVGQNGTGSGNCPVSRESIGKWTNTSNSISSVQGIQQEAGDLASGSEVVVLGWDPADTHTDNFWEPLASVNGDGSSTNLSSGTITAKKYLWIQSYTQTADSHKMTFNNDTGTNYARRWGANGGSENINTTNNGIGTQWTTTTCFCNMFIANISGQEKLVLGNDVERNSANDASSPPYRFNFVGKWTGTSQITEIDFNKTGNFTSTDYIKVWGSN
jgi:hypothetical protein